MLFSSQAFILWFLPATLAAFALLPGKRLVLLGASLVFYGWWSAPHVALLCFSIGVNFWLGNRILAAAPVVARRWTIAGVALNLAVLGWFKYADFVAASAGLAWRPGVLLPLAISFFTFQQIMFLVDSYRRARPPAGLLAYACFVAFFPHLIAGPLVRPAEILPQLAGALRLRAEDVADGLTLFLLGLAKKLVLADSFAPFADAGFNAAAAGRALTFFEAWYAVLAYALQIYFDFSGYSDMARGLARMFGIGFPVNFASPYKSRTISEFWRRWHITLSRFLRDYVYIPLGGNRRGAWRRGANLMATMLLGGLWHGAAWNFVLWGGLHGAFLLVHARWQGSGWRLPGPVAQALTLLAVLVAWVPFRASGLPATAIMLRGMAGLEGIALPQLVIALVPPLGWIARPVPVLAALGDARTLAFPEATACLALGWAIALCAPSTQALTASQRSWALGAGFAFTMQALFFAPAATPFLYFRF